MLNLLTKTKPWMVASLIVATSVFGQNNASGSCAPACPPKPCPKPCPQPCPPTQMCPADPCCPAWPTPVLNAAYNYPARIQTRCPWDFYADASFIYWQPIQENMELCIDDSTAQDVSEVNGTVTNMSFDFKPGFKLGIGGNFDHDNWDMQLNYTWFHNSNSKTAEAAAVGSLHPMWGNPDFAEDDYDSIHAKWNLKMDILDLNLGRWYYVGTKLVFRPSFGIMADWIRQSARITSNRVLDTAVGITTADEGYVKYNSRSWAVGPKVGLESNWNICSGFRVFGNGEADLLFTDYTKLSYFESHTADATSNFTVKQKKVYAVRPHLDLELGLGWGTYLDCNNWYMDFALGYEFQVFFNQNMFRHFNDDTMIANSTLPNGDLFVQGLTATFRLDF